MKRFTSLFVVGLLALSVCFSAQAAPDTDKDAKKAIENLNAEARAAITEARWEVFSESLVDALQSDHNGLKQAAMRLVIQHGANVDVGDAVFDVMRVYRDGEKVNMRRMALVTLGKMENTWAIGFLKLSDKYEKSPVLQQTIRAVVADYEANHE